MNVLLTGATGFVGRNLLPALKNCGHEVFVLVRPSSDYGDLGAEHVIEFAGDVCHLKTYMQQHSIEGIIHLASLYIAEHQPDQIQSLVQSNICLGTQILEACKFSGVKWFLNTGTIWQNYNMPSQSDQYCPVNLYAASKQAFIDMARYYTETSNLCFCTLKLCDTFGPGDTRRKIFALFEEIAETGKMLDMSAGEQLLDILHIDDVVAGFCHLVQMLHDGEATRGEYVLSSGLQIPLKRLAEIYEQNHHVRLNINWGKRPYRQREVMKPYIGNVLPGWTPTKLSHLRMANIDAKKI